MVGLFLITSTFILKASSPNRNTLFLLTKLLQPALEVTNMPRDYLQLVTLPYFKL